MFKNKRKWIPLASYKYLSIDYVIYGKMQRNGIIKFTTRKMTRFMTESSVSHLLDLDVKDQWNKIINSGL